MPLIHQPPENLIIRPGQRSLTIKEVVQRIGGFMAHLTGLEFIILIHRKDAPLNDIVMGRNIPLERVRDTLRVALNDIDKLKRQNLETAPAPSDAAPFVPSIVTNTEPPAPVPATDPTLS